MDIPQTEYFAQRVQSEYIRRMEALAAKLQMRSPRPVLEMCLDAHLPVLEKQFGVDVTPRKGNKRPFANPDLLLSNATLTSRGDSANLQTAPEMDGVVAQLVEHHNGIQDLRRNGNGCAVCREHGFSMAVAESGGSAEGISFCSAPSPVAAVTT